MNDTFLTFILASVSVCTISFGIAYHYRIKNAANNVHSFLFDGNTPYLASSSNIMSMISLAIVINYYLGAIAGYGLWALVAITLGIIVGYIILCVAVIKRQQLKVENTASEKNHAHSQWKLTLIDIVGQTNKGSINFLRWLMLVQYFLLLTAEYVVFLTLLKGILQSPFAAYLITIAVSFMCGCYTSIGGFRGVLKTDFFQLTLFFFGIIFLLSTNFHSIIELATFNLNEANLDKNFCKVSWYSFGVIVTFTAAFFCSFPDVWIRNFSTLKRNKDSKIKTMYGSCVGGMMIFMGITFILASPIVAEIPVFKQTYNTYLPLERMIFYFNSKPILAHNINFLWYFFITLVCVYVTTMDTWLIGLMQHSSKKIQSALHKVSFIPFVYLFFVILIGSVISKELFYVCGILLFPSFTFNLIVFAFEIASPNTPGLNSRELTWFLISSFVITILQCVYHYGELGHFGVIIWGRTLLFMLILGVSFLTIKRFKYGN